MFFDASNWDAELLLAVLADDAFVGDDVVDSFTDRFVDLLLVTSAVRRNSIGICLVFFEDRHATIITILCALEMKFRVGQRLRVNPLHLETTELWLGPPLSSIDVPVTMLEAGTTCLVLGGLDKCYQVLVDGRVGWLDEHDLEDL